MDGQIRIFSEILDMEGERIVDERSLPCEYALTESGFKVFYSEMEEDEIHTSLEVGDFGVRLTRKGFIESVMLFAEKETKACQYKTGYGEIDMWIETEEVEKQIKVETLELKLRYHIYMSGELFSKNFMEIMVLR